MNSLLNDVKNTFNDQHIEKCLGVTVNELWEAGWDGAVHANISEDGLVYDYFLDLPETAPLNILNHIIGLDGYRAHLGCGPIEEDDRPKYEDD